MEHNLTPEQRVFPKRIKQEAYNRLPETCNHVREILNEAQTEIINEYEIDPAEIVGLDLILSAAFMKIRDQVTQKFRTEQMRLLNELMEIKDLLCEVKKAEETTITRQPKQI